jgi:hypothetical protein
MPNISTLIEKRAYLEKAKTEHPELSDLFELLDEMIVAIVEFHSRTGVVTFVSDPTAAAPVAQSSLVSIPNINATVTGTYSGMIPGCKP